MLLFFLFFLFLWSPSLSPTVLRGGVPGRGWGVRRLLPGGAPGGGRQGRAGFVAAERLRTASYKRRLEQVTCSVDGFTLFGVCL